MGAYEEFAKAVAADPSLIERLKKSQGLSEFKDKYDVDKASGLKCPVCAVFFQYPGSLWYKSYRPDHFVCRKCHLEFTLTCNTIDNADLITELKLIGKGEQAFPSWMKGNIRGDED